ncbi:MAG TPA: potassium-transporting ATPase subunit KdpA, partial [Acidimicrobiia bacterium]|nr:potassium-transporting ATPase subunit KdpA [Acidimicrobiia bacterium]
MTAAGWLELAALIGSILVTVPLLGAYMAKVYDPSLGKPRGDRFFSAIERPIFKVCGIDPESEQRWSTYALSLAAFSLVSVLILYLQLRLQGHLFLNPDHFKDLDPKLSFNTAVSFLTNTNWQAYGDGVMSQATQMLGLAFHNFVSAAAGAAVAVALIRGLARRRSRTLGNFWVDMIRTCTRILLPITFVAAVLFLSQGVIMNFSADKPVTTVAGQTQTIPGGPLASQEAVKEGGQNGGGYFGTNSMHPFENPTPFADLLQLWLMLAIPFAFTYAFGKMVRDQKQGWVVFATMFVMWLGMLLIVTPLETRGNPKLTALGANQQTTALQSGGNMEGKDTRFGPISCGYYAASTTSTSDGSVNCAHDSLTPLAGGVTLVNMM